MREAFVGIDAAFAKRKRLPIAVCSWEAGRLVPYQLRSLSVEPPRGSGNAAVLDNEVVDAFAAAAARYVERVAEELGVEIVRIGIDAPNAPRPDSLHRREAERALDEAGISCFATPSVSRVEEIRAKVKAHLDGGGPENRLPHANQLWMIVGFALFDHLSQLAECIEVFPQATARVLGTGSIHKSKGGGVEAQLRAAARHTGWPTEDAGGSLASIAWAPTHDCLDAYLSAWVAALDEEDRIPFGTPPDDAIWVPRVPDQDLARVKPQRPASSPSAAEGRGPADLSPRARSGGGGKRSRRRQPVVASGRERREYSCPLPGCGKVFQDSRGGWDGHVGSRRMHPNWHPGVDDPEKRKRLFREEHKDWF